MDKLIDTLKTMPEPSKPLIDVGNWHSLNAIAFFGDTAKDSLRTNPKEFKDKYRTYSKACGLGLAYGGSPRVIKDAVGCSDQEANRIFEAFFQNLPSFKAYLENTFNDAKRTKYITTFIGRRIYIDAFNSEERRIQAAGRRHCYNYPIQGGGAEMIKLMAVKSTDYIYRNKLSRWVADLINDQSRYTRVVTCTDQVNNPDFIKELSELKSGNVKLLQVEGDKVLMEYPRNLQMSMEFIRKFNLKVDL